MVSLNMFCACEQSGIVMKGVGEMANEGPAEIWT